MSDLSNESSHKKKGLGRGFGALIADREGIDLSVQLPKAQQTSKIEIPEVKVQNQPVMTPSQLAETKVDPENKIWHVGIDRLSSGTYQPRKQFSKDSLLELSQSIKENGILQPVIARRTASGKLEIVAGERRWRAAQLAGLQEIPVILRNYEDQQALELAIIENIQREDLNVIEEAEGYQRLANDFKLTHQQIAERVGKDRATVSNALRLLGLTQDVKDLLISGDLSAGHAKVLLSATSAIDQSRLAKLVVKQKLSVRKLEKMVLNNQQGLDLESEVTADPAQEAKAKLIHDLENKIQQNLSTKVQIEYSQGKGRVVLHFYSDDELNQLSDRLLI